MAGQGTFVRTNDQSTNAAAIEAMIEQRVNKAIADYETIRILLTGCDGNCCDDSLCECAVTFQGRPVVVSLAPPFLILYIGRLCANKETHQLIEVSEDYFEVQNSDFASGSNQKNPEFATGIIERSHETCEASQQLFDGQSNNFVPSLKQEDTNLPTGRVEISYFPRGLLMKVVIWVMFHFLMRVKKET
ncbi:hypothetical protein E3N88_37830 [Mikania micrantha]|uniref:Uncharacterized protein n=1 Tax=Mikania micrantha TaxID=192012 RepID=A0A5N6LSB6_9ASTR|nr:hypothetical protein E3N88_37830 [Mikania micrantha]